MKKLLARLAASCFPEVVAIQFIGLDFRASRKARLMRET